MTLSRVVRDLDDARRALADPGDALDLRVAAGLEDEWARLGAVEVVPGELAVPVPQVLSDVAATRALGTRLARLLRAGDLVVLSGPLGAGKTALTQGIGAGLGVRGTVTSPTFVLARVHRGPVPLVHVDAYRLRTSDAPIDLDDLDLDDELPYSVTVVEWGEGVVEQVSPSRLHVVLDRAPDAEDGRVARIFCHGLRWSALASR